MPLLTYEQTRPWARVMAHAVQMKMMPPWFADPRYGHFANDTSLTDRKSPRSCHGLSQELRQGMRNRRRRKRGPTTGISERRISS